MATIRKRNGKWQVQVRRVGQRPISRSFHNKSDAQVWGRQKELQADKNELTYDPKKLSGITVGQLVDRYLREITPQKKSAKAEAYVLTVFKRNLIANRSLSEISPNDFAKYRDLRLQTLKPAALRRELNPIQNMFEIARDEWGLPIKENPLSKLKLKAVDTRRERRLKEGELERLIKAGEETKNPHVIPVARFALETAMRRGEILALTWSDYDEARKMVTIRQSKNGYSRTIPLSPKAIALLHSCRREGAEEKIFPTTANALRLAWVRLCRRAQIEDLHFHDLRHEAISRFFELGLTVPEVASISGHRDMRMLLRYAHANQQAVQRKLSGSTNGR